MSDGPLFLRDDLPHGGLNGTVNLDADDPPSIARHKARPTMDLRCPCGRGGYIIGDCPPCKQDEAEKQEYEQAAIRMVSAQQVVTTHKELRPIVINDIVRLGETCNVIAHPKVGKSFLVHGTAVSVASGMPWLGHETMAGEVLLIDNELHIETLAGRLRRIAQAYNVGPDVLDRIQTLALRGKLKNLITLGPFFRSLPSGRFRLVIIDAWYRTLPIGIDENKNADITGLYNQLDQYADHLGAAFLLVHHSSKGSQNEKSITDVGSGAGSQSRAADTHIILRPHEEENVVVMDGVTRSFPPLPPKCLRWEYPFFTVAHGLDPGKLAVTTKRRRKPDNEDPAETIQPKEIWDASRFAAKFGTEEPSPRSMVIDRAVAAGLAESRAERLLRAAVDAELLHEFRASRRGKKMMVSTRKQREKTDAQCARDQNDATESDSES